MKNNILKRLGYAKRTDKIFNTKGVVFKEITNPIISTASIMATSKSAAAARQEIDSKAYSNKSRMISTRPSRGRNIHTSKEILDFINVQGLVNKGYKVYLAQKGPKYLFAFLDPNGHEDLYLYSLSPMKQRGAK